MASLTIIFDVAVYVLPLPQPQSHLISTSNSPSSMCLPFPVLIKSQIQDRQKFVLLGLLALGIFITVIQVIRIQTVHSLTNYLDSAPLTMWSTVENNLGIIVASVPTLAPLFKYFAGKTLRSSAGKSGNRSRSTYALGSMPLGSGVDHVSRIRAGSEDAGSEEFIIGDLGAITKTTDVNVTSEPASHGLVERNGQAF